MFLVSSHTILPSLKGMKADFHRSIIQIQASSCVARASSHLSYIVFSKKSGMVIDVYPSINLNGVFGLSACLLSLQMNSRVGNK
jgi:hypothetical protein